MKTGIEIKPIISKGYENIYIYDTWKVSMLSYLDELKKENKILSENRNFFV